MSKETNITEFKFFDLPFEIREIIYTYYQLIRDTKTQLAIRNVCSEWRKLIKDIIVYDNNNAIKLIHKFKSNQFLTLFSNGNLNRKMVFEPYSKFKYIEYNKQQKLIKIIENFPPYKIKMHEQKDFRIHTKKTNILTGETKIEISNKFECMNQLNPIIENSDPILNNNHPHQDLIGGPMCSIA